MLTLSVMILLKNILSPNLGMANTPYARSVRPTRKLPGAPPDAGLIFDSEIFSTAMKTYVMIVHS